MYITIIGSNGSSDYKRLSEVSMSIVDVAKDEFVKKILEILICYPDWRFRNEKFETSFFLRVIGFLRNELHLF